MELVGQSPGFVRYLANPRAQGPQTLPHLLRPRRQLFLETLGVNFEHRQLLVHGVVELSRDTPAFLLMCRNEVGGKASQLGLALQQHRFALLERVLDASAFRNLGPQRSGDAFQLRSSLRYLSLEFLLSA